MIRNITPEKVARFFVTLALIALLAAILYYYSNLVAYALIATLIAYLLDPLVNRMQAAGMNRTLAITLTLSTLTLLIIWITTSFIPVIATQMAILAGQLSIENIQHVTEQAETFMIRHFDFLPPGFLIENVTQLAENVFDTNQIPNLMGNLIGLFTNLFYAFLVIPFATFFFLKDGTRIRKDLLYMVPNKYFETTLSLIDKVETGLGRYFRSVLFQCSLVGLFAWLFLSISGLTNAASVGITIGFANIIPYFGPLLGYLLSIVVAIVETGDFSLVLPVLLAILAVQIMDNILFQPLIFSRSASMHPVAILFIILIGAQTAGLIGMLLAVPIATTFKITFNQIVWSLRNYRVYRADLAAPARRIEKMDTDPPTG